MRRAAGLLFALGSLALAAGCHRSDLVEAELRSRENDLRAMHADVDRLSCENDALMRELQAVRQGTGISPELASQTTTLKQITLGRLTGGYDADDCPGDEALQVVLEPRDCDGHILKAPGALHVDALEISVEGLKVPLSSWDLTPEEVRRTWRSGFWSTGYFVVLPWRNWPSSDHLRVVARFGLADGRVFEADKDVTIHQTPVSRRKQLPAAPPGAPAGPELFHPDTPPQPLTQPDANSASARTAWWMPGQAPEPVPPTPTWRPQEPPSLADSVELLRPQPLTRQPGEKPWP